MPITQDRMIRLIEASTELLANYNELLREAARNPEIGAILTTLSQAGLLNSDINRLVDLYDSLIEKIKYYAPSAEVGFAIGKEESHFNLRRAKNNRTRDLMRIARDRQRERDEEVQYAAITGETNARINLDRLQALAYQKSQNQFNPITYYEVAQIIKAMGQHDQRIQIEIIKELIASGRALDGQEHPGELVITKPGETGATRVEAQETEPLIEHPETDGLLPDHIISLRKPQE